MKAKVFLADISLSQNLFLILPFITEIDRKKNKRSSRIDK